MESRAPDIGLLVTHFEERRPYWNQHLFQYFANAILHHKVENELCGQKDLGSGPRSTTYNLDDLGKMISFPQNSFENLQYHFFPSLETYQELKKNYSFGKY